MSTLGLVCVSSPAAQRIAARACLVLAAAVQVGCGQSGAKSDSEQSQMCGSSLCDARVPPRDGGSEHNNGNEGFTRADAAGGCESDAGCPTSALGPDVTGGNGAARSTDETDSRTGVGSTADDTIAFDYSSDTDPSDGFTGDTTSSVPSWVDTNTDETAADQSTAAQSTTNESTADQSTADQSTADESTTDESTADQSTTDESTADESTTHTSHSHGDTADPPVDSTEYDTSGTETGADNTSSSPVEAGAADPVTPSITFGPATLAADGVAVLSTADLAPDAVIGLELDGQAIDPNNPEHVQWLEAVRPLSEASAERSTQLAVRAPSTVQPGQTTLRVLTRTGSLSWPVEIIRPSGAYPSSPAGIAWPSVANSGVFPISTVAAGILIVDTDTGVTTDSGVQYRLWMLSAGRRDCPVARAGKGILYGTEVIDATHGDPNDGQDGNGEVFEHAIEGEYELHADANFIRISIDRTASGGVVERYVGGWVSYPDNNNLLAPKLPDPSERAHPPPLDADTAMVVLTSELTGRQLIMSRRIEDREETNTIRVCLPELP